MRRYRFLTPMDLRPGIWVLILWAVSGGSSVPSAGAGLPVNEIVARNDLSPAAESNGFGDRIAINEIMYHPFHLIGQPEDLAAEFIELFNAGSETVDLSGWRFTKGIGFAFPDGTSLEAGGYLIVAADVEHFKGLHPGSGPIVGGWDGHLSNSGETLLLVDRDGVQVDRVPYADEGDWSVRQEGPLDHGYRGWVWSDVADGGGGSLELLRVDMSNESGQNWASSLVDGGTPGRANSVAASGLAPMILDVRHSPAIPRPGEAVTVTARIDTDSPAGVTVSVWHRLDGQAGFTQAPMFDDGLHGDAQAGDGVYGASLPGQADKVIVEWYIEAVDYGGAGRTWPAPVEGKGQVANALYQVDVSYDPLMPWTAGSPPVYRLIMKEKERADLAYIGSHSGNEDSDAQMNGTFISLDGTGAEVEYRVGIRNRGNGTRMVSNGANNYHVNFPHDQSWKGVTAININCHYTYSQVLGGLFFHLSGVASPDQTRVLTTVNGRNLADPGSRMYGSYAAKEVFDSDFADHWFPEDPSGNLYLCFYDASFSPRDEPDLRYEGPTPDPYRNCYFKKTNLSQEDWSDLIRMTYAFSHAPDETFYQDIGQVIAIDQWMRYLAADALMGNNEGGLCTGDGDDYGLYCGLIDRRFRLVPHDLDTLFNSGQTGKNIFSYASLPSLSRLLNHPDIVRLYYSHLLDLMDTVFASETFDRLVEQNLDGWVPSGTITGIQAFMRDRIASVRSQIPQQFAITTPAAAAVPARVTSPEVTVAGTVHAGRARSVRVNGSVVPEAGWSQRTGKWSLSRVLLNPGLNRITVQAFDGPAGTGTEVDRGSVDVWYDTATVQKVQGTVSGQVLETRRLMMEVPAAYLSGIPVEVRLQVVQDEGDVDLGLWDAKALLSVSPAGVTASVQEVSLFNGQGTALVTFSGSGDFDLKASLGAFEANRHIVDWTREPVVEVSGTIGDTDWRGVVRVLSDLQIPAGVTLTIQPGTFVLVDGVASGDKGADIDVLGAIRSLGTADAPVVFTAADPAMAWGEIHHQGATVSTYAHTQVCLAGRSPGAGHTGAGPAIRPQNTTLVMEDCILADEAGKVMQASGSDLTFRGCVMARSVMGPEVSGTALLLEDCFFSDMRNPNDSDAIYIHDQKAGQIVLLKRGVIAGADDDGIDTLGSTVTVEDYIIRDIADKAITVYNGDVTVRRSLMADVALAPEDGSGTCVSSKGTAGQTVTVRLDHCTIVGTDIGIQARNKYGVGNVVARYYVTNSIILAQDPIQTDYDPADIHVDYSDVMGETWPGTRNIQADPLFVSAPAHDYHLRQGSPCIGAGLADGLDTDLGCYSYTGTAATPGKAAVWAAGAGPYQLAGDVIVPAGTTLTIEPGTSVFFESSARLVVQGRLMAEGSPYREIRFTRVPQTQGTWGGIQFDKTVADNRLRWAILDYGRTLDGMVGAEESGLWIEDCVFDHTDLRRIRTQDSILEVRRCTFTDIFGPDQAPTTDNLSEHIWGSVSLAGDLLVEDCTFGLVKGHNDCIDVDGPSGPDPAIRIMNNRFLGGGDDALDLEGDAYIEGNVFTHFLKDSYNTAARNSNVMSAGAGKHYQVVRNVFWDVDHVAQVKDGAFMDFINNTVVRTTDAALYFELPGQTQGPGRGAYVDGCIFRTAAPVFDRIEKVADLAANRSILPEVWHGLGAGNIDADPLFVDPNGDFRLLPDSPARCAGPEGRDMGAYQQGGDSTGPAPALRINEVLAGDGNGLDWVELSYDGPSALDLTGIALTDEPNGPARFVFAQGITLRTGEYLVLPATDLGFSLDAEGDGVYLYDPAGGVIDAVEFGLQVPGLSIGRIGTGPAWHMTIPTPGEGNILQPLGDPRGLKINEWLAAGRILFEDGFIEIFNPSPQPVHLGGLALTDHPVRPQTEGLAFRIHDLSFIAAKGFAVLIADGKDRPGHTGLALSAEGEILYLLDQDLNEIDKVSFGPQTLDVSQGRTPDGAVLSEFFSLPTPGLANPATVQPSMVNIVPIDQAWRYREGGGGLASDWNQAGFDDTAWPQGKALLYVEESELPATPNTPLKLGSIAYYFRTHVNIALDLASVLRWELSTVFDDGAVVYVNGSEALSIRMPTGPVDGNTASQTTVSNAQLEGPFVVQPYLFHAGDNVIAVEVHQEKLSSSDIVMGLQLDAVVEPKETSLLAAMSLLKGIRITELMYHSPIGADGDYIEIQNISAAPLDLAGVRIEGAVDFLFPGVSLGAGRCVVVVANRAAFELAYGPGATIAGQYTGNLNNQGEQVVLKLPWPYEAAILRFTYSDSWHPLTDGGGQALVVNDPASNVTAWADPAGWHADRPTPGW